MLISLVQVVAGLALLVFGADYMIRAAVSLARRAGVSPLVIGLSVVALGTSLPELVVSLQAALSGSTGLMVGNVVGSNIANILLILGVSALIFPVVSSRQALVRDGGAMMVATLVFIGAGLTFGGFGWGFGVVGLALLALYIGYSYHSDQSSGDDLHAQEGDEVEGLKGPLWFILLVLVGGLVGVVVGADLLVEGAVAIARGLGVGEEVIGLTLVAFGTSVPELAASIAAALRRHSDIALGNVLGSNVFNLLGVTGVTALVAPIPMPPMIAQFDLWIMLGASIALLVFMRSGWRIGRTEGGLFLAAYFAFVGVQFAV